jgi:hypothetical protein
MQNQKSGKTKDSGRGSKNRKANKKENTSSTRRPNSGNEREEMRTENETA